jgi:hypothetical protein
MQSESKNEAEAEADVNEVNDITEAAISTCTRFI